MKRYAPLLFLGLFVGIGFRITTVFAYTTISPGPEYTRSHGVGTGEFIYELAPGESVTSDVTIGNTDNSPVTVQIISTDARKDAIGGFLVGNPDHSVGFGTWANIDSSAYDFITDGGLVTLGPGERHNLYFTFTVPTNAAPGPYFGSLMLLGAAPDSKQTQTGSAVRTGVAVRVSINVTGEEIIAYDWTGMERVPTGNKVSQSFMLGFTNDGNLSMDAVGTFRVRDLFDNLLFEKNVDTQIVPGNVRELGLTWEAPPSIGFFKASAELNFRKSAFLEGQVNDFLGQAQKKELSFFIIPWIPVLIVFAIIFIFMLFLSGRHLRMKKFISSLSEYKVKKGDTLTGLAANSGVNWKLLARANKIKPPYSVSEGQTILLPKKKKSNS